MENTTSKKDLRDIEKDLLNEVNQTFSEKSQSSEGQNNENFQSNSQANQSVQIPKAIPGAILGAGSYLIYEKRIKLLPKKNQEDARELVKPTEKQIDLMGQLLTWASDRYGVSFFESPYFLPITLAGQIAQIEFVKFQSFKHIQDLAREGEQ